LDERQQRYTASVGEKSIELGGGGVVPVLTVGGCR
jgi:hypothetical protein